MTGSRSSRPSKPRLDLDLEDPGVARVRESTGTFPSVPPSSVDTRQSVPRATPVTVPAPDPRVGVDRAEAVRLLRAPSSSHSDGAREGSQATDPLFDAFPRLPRGSSPSEALAEANSDRPTRPAPAETLLLPEGAVAPRPPRLPTLGPEPEISFALDPDVLPAEPLPDEPESVEQVMSAPRDPARDRPGEQDFSEPLFSETAAVPSSGARVDELLEGSVVSSGSASWRQVRELRERFALGDFSGALLIAESMLADDPDNIEVRRFADQCRTKLEEMYRSRIGALTQVPVVVVSPAELRTLSLDHRAGFVLSLIDGASSVEDLIDVSGMPVLEVLRIFFELLAEGVIELRPSRR